MKKLISVLLVALMLISVVFALGVSAETYKLGDIDKDGKITPSDARTILRIAAQIEKVDETDKLIADVISDNKINAADARLVLRIAAKLEKELGEITIGETTTQPVDPADLTELTDAIGADIEDYIDNFSDMKKADGNSYSNGYVTVTADSKVVAEGVVSSVSITGGNYAVNGVYVGMNADDAVSELKNQNWIVKSDSSLSVGLTKYGMSMRLSVAGDKVTMVEYFIGSSLVDDNTTTTLPEETTTKEPETTTKAPETTTKEPETTTKQPDETTTKAEEPEFPVGNDDFNALPDPIKAYVTGEFALEGVRYEKENKVPTAMTLSNGNVYVKVTENMSDGSAMTLEMLIDNSGSKSKVYFLNSKNMNYTELSSFLMLTLGIDEDMLDVEYTEVDINSISAEVNESKLNGADCTVYTLNTGTEICDIFMVDDEIKKIITYDMIGTIKSQMDISSFRASQPGDATLANYKKGDLMSVLGVSLEDILKA